MNEIESPLTKALSLFDAAEANLVKLERLWRDMEKIMPSGIEFGDKPEYEDRCRAYESILNALPLIDGWKPESRPLDINEMSQMRLDATEVGEIECQVSVEQQISAPGREIRKYRFLLNEKRRAIIREALIELIDGVDRDLRELQKDFALNENTSLPVTGGLWNSLKDQIDQIDMLLGSSVKRSKRWDALHRHLAFALVQDLNDITKLDWPDIKVNLREGLYGANEPVPVGVDDLSSLVAAKPRGPMATKLHWERLDPSDFERLIFSLIGNEPGYENPEWLMHTNAPDRGRDLSVSRVFVDRLAGTQRYRVIIQCKHWREKSVGPADVATLKDQMTLWEPPRVDIHIIATSGRFTSDAVSIIEKNNQSDTALKIEMWPESHLERLLASRPALIAEFKLR